MSLQTVFSPFQTRPGLSYHLSLAIGAMLAALLVVAYAAGASDVSAVRTHIVLQGAEIILLTVASGVIAGALHLLSTAGDSALAVLSGSRNPVNA
jgi:hypothetical protein